MLPGEPAERGGQRVTRDFLDGAQPHNAGEARRCQAAARRLLKLQQAARIAQQHLTFDRQRDGPRAPGGTAGPPQARGA
jgi:hypothetical protein